MSALLRRLPLAMSAAALGTAGLGNLLASHSPLLRIACGAVAAALTLLVVVRIALDLDAVKGELRTPAALAVFPTLFMSLMLLATYLEPVAALPARALWITALVFQLAVVAVFVVRFVLRFRLDQVLPGWFLVFVGFVVASVTSPAFGMQSVGRPLLYAGLVGYALALPLVALRLAKGPALPDPAAPTLAIFLAPPSLCLVGYLAVVEAPQPAAVYALLAFVGASLLYVLACLPRMLKVRFCPSYAALTFPAVIGATAIKQSAAFLSKAQAGPAIPPQAVPVMEMVAVLAVLYVLARYTALLLGRPADEPEPLPAGAA